MAHILHKPVNCKDLTPYGRWPGKKVAAFFAACRLGEKCDKKCVMTDDKEKKEAPAEEKADEAEFEDFEEDEGLDSTMMDIDLKDLESKGDDKGAEGAPSEARAADEESVEDLLKKKKSLLGKLGLKK